MIWNIYIETDKGRLDQYQVMRFDTDTRLLLQY